MNAIITDKYNWNAHKTTDIDRSIANELLKCLRSKDYDYPEAKIELQKEIRRLLGFSIPEECLFIIKEYLLLPTCEYILRKDWWAYHFSKPYIMIKKEVYRSYKSLHKKYQKPIPKLPPDHISSVRALYKITSNKPATFNWYVKQMISPFQSILGEVCMIEGCGSQSGRMRITKLPVKNYKILECNKEEDQYMCEDCYKIPFVKCKNCNSKTQNGVLCVKCETEEYALFRQSYCRLTILK